MILDLITLVAMIPVTGLANAIVSRHTRLQLEVVDSTDKAVRVRDPNGRMAWLPARAIVDHYDGTVTLPKRLANAKGLSALRIEGKDARTDT